MNKTIRLATRQSKLALWQANFVKTQLLAKHNGLNIELIPLSTEGDQVQDRSLAQMGGKGLFIKRLEEALLANEADFAVHSMKDMPPVLEPAFCIPAILKREEPWDVLVSEKYNSLNELPAGARIGTSSVRRSAQIKYFRPDLQTRPLRGNVDTRIKKLLENDEFDALIMAKAGLKRLGMDAHIKETLSAEICLPSVGQGAIGIECLSKNQELIKILSSLNDRMTQTCVLAERSLNAHLGANCNSPVGSYAYHEKDQLILTGEILNLEGSNKLRIERKGNNAEVLGLEVAQELINKDAKSLF